MSNSVTEASRSLREAISDARRGLVERDSLIEMVALAAVAGEHLLFIGPPGTAKSEAVRGSAAILNTRLGILNERLFRRGHTRLHCPLRVCVGASNALPEDESLAAFADRFLLRTVVDPIADPSAGPGRRGTVGARSASSCRLVTTAFFFEHWHYELPSRR